MKKVILYSILILLSGSSTFIHANKRLLRKADRQYKNHQYADAIDNYEKITEKFNVSDRLANSYYFNARYEEAVKWYEDFFQKTNDSSFIEPEYYRRYSLCLKSLERYEKADQYLLKYYQLLDETNSDIANYLKEIEENSGKYEVENIRSINSESSDYGTTIYDSLLVFTSSRKNSSAQELVPWNNQPFTSLYVSKKDDKNRFKEVKPFLKEIISERNESTPVFSKDGNTVYFTRNSTNVKNSNDILLLKIYRAKRKKGKWREITELFLNSDGYSTAHPALSHDGNTLYFTSDRPGGFGDTDIWKVHINEDGQFDEPENLGPNVNTQGKESFPFVSEDNILYYASDGKLGLGGLDIFSVKITKTGYYEPAVNVGKPINSPMDDFAFYIDSKKDKGYFSSNRKGGRGADDIYQFASIENLIIGTVTDLETGESIARARVKLFNQREKLISTTFTDFQGKFRFEKDLLKDRKSYRVRIESPYYATENKFIDTQKSKINVTMRTIALEPEVGKDLGIASIYFNLGNSDIDTDAVIELSKILQVLQDYPQLKLEIRSHTDSKGSDTSNQKLSEKRAKATRKWLIQNGIDPDRLTAKGFGETEIINECLDGVECLEEDHFVNRRSEFIVTSMGEEQK